MISLKPSILLACGDKTKDTLNQFGDLGANSVIAPDFVGVEFSFW